MINKQLTIFAFLFLLFSSALITKPIFAANCSYHCNDLSKYKENENANFCHSLGGTVTISIFTDCPTPPTCGANNVPVCCCGTGNFTIENNQIANNAPAPIATKATPRFQIPELSIQIPGMATFTQGNCVTDANDQTECTVNWIGEYINGIYNYALGVAGILAVIVLMIGGIIWLVSGGDMTKITQSKELIIGSITGLVLLLCSYVLLYQINPDLTKFKALTLGYIDEIPLMKDSSDSEANNNGGACAGESSLVKVSGTNANDPRLTPDAAEGLKKANTEAANQGVSLMVTDAFRSFATQQALWEKALKIYKDPEVAKWYVAKPDNAKCSSHLAGVAIDVCLKGTASCGNMGYKNKSNAKYSDADVTKLQTIMKTAGWIRYCGEWWHFQYNAPPKTACSP